MSAGAARTAGGLVVAAALTLLTSGLSRLSVTLSDPDDALLRLSWRVEGIAVETCRERTADELARLPVHMRSPRACVGGTAPYVLRVVMDGRAVRVDTVRAAGARGDRPLFVYLELPVAPGPHDAQVTFRPLVPEGFELPADAADLEWRGEMEMASREVALVTVDPEADRLVLRLRGER